MTSRTHYLVIQYDGTHYCGWQRQPKERTVQAELEHALEKLAGVRVVTHAAGRTDAGVHALGQVVSFQTHLTIPPNDLRRAVNANTPRDLWIAEAGLAPDGFHARKHAASRRYRYVVGCDAAASSPFRRPFEWDLGQPLNLDVLNATAQLFRGEHDFRALSTVGQEKPHYRCAIRDAVWQARPNREGFIFTVEADRFLHRMVRFVVGMSVDVARNRRPLEDIARLLESVDNQAASPPAPARGLYFVQVRYPNLELKDNA